jgi:hypothetical protein
LCAWSDDGGAGEEDKMEVEEEDEDDFQAVDHALQERCEFTTTLAEVR